MNKLPIPQECQSIKLQENIARWTPVNDLRVLLHLAAQTPGNILEIGCNEGITTKELALAFPDRKVYGVDYVGPVVTMCPDQRWERPSHIGVHCLDISNAVIFNELSNAFDYAKCPGVRFVFIDADHTYDAVKADTEKAIAFLKSVGGGTIVWHDYKEDAACYGVKKYLDEEIDRQFPVTVYDGTWIATANVPCGTILPGATGVERITKRILINHEHMGFGDWIMMIAVLKMLQSKITDLTIDLWVTDAYNSSLMAMPGQCGLRCQFVGNPNLESYHWYWPRPSQWPHLHSDHIMADKLRELNAALGTCVPLDMTCLARPIALEPVPVPDGDFVVMPSEGSHGINSQEKNWKGFSELAEKLKGVAYSIVQIGAKEDFPIECADFDYRGIPYPQLCYVVSKAKFAVGVEDGIGHLAGHMGVKSYIIFKSTVDRHAKPENVYYPGQTALDYTKREITVESVFEDINQASYCLCPTGHPGPVGPPGPPCYRFHLLGLAHVPTTPEIRHCAYSAKIYKLASMLKSLGHTVYFYGGEGSKVECDESIAVVSDKTRKQVYGDYDWKKDFFKHDPKDYAHRSFNGNAIREINKRKQEGDFLLCPMGNYDQSIAEGVKLRFTVESGIGYSGVFAEFRVWESYAWMHHVYGMGGNDQTNGRWYDAVIPNYYNPAEFHMGPPKDYYLFVGRLISRKGLSIAAEVTAKLGVKLIVAGQGDLSKVDSYDLTKYKNIEHVGTVDGPQLANLMAGALAVFCPTWYIGPFEGVHIEAAMAGVPTITTDWGVFTETVVQGVTGYRCRTFNDFLHAAREVPKLRGETIRNYAIANFSMNRVAAQYQQYFDNIYDIRKTGWYEEHQDWNPGWLGRTPPRLVESS